MSTPSLTLPKSPPRQWLSNEEQSTGRSSEHVASSQAVVTDSVPASTGGGEKNETAPSMNNPIDENLFYSAPSQPRGNDATAGKQDVDDPADPEIAAEDIMHPPDVKPFFTLIEDPQSGEHHHPTVHYVFSDDDPEILTNAALEALQARGEDSQHELPADHVEERYVIVDIAADGKTVTSASSLSRDWQAVRTSSTQAPSWGDDAKTEDKGLMLKISGLESTRLGYAREKRTAAQAGDNIDDLVTAFSQRLDSLEEVLGRAQDLNAE